MRFTIIVSLPYSGYIPNLAKIGPVVFKKKKRDGRRRTPTNSNRPPEKLGVT